MTKTEKAKIIEELTQEFKEASGIAVCDYKGLNVKQLESLRNKAREKNLKVKVVKNTLAQIALKNANYQDIELSETNIMLWGKDQVSLAKLLVEYAKENEEKFKIKFGFSDGKQVTPEQIDAISKLPSKEQLIAMLLSTWSTPMRNFASVLQAPIRNFVTVLDNIRAKKEST